jgi:hypothetical protein
VEAGVDIDFPAVWRAFAPLDAVAQAAGRCNREGKHSSGVVTVFLPPLEKTLYPSPHYERAAVTLKQMLMVDPSLYILDPATVYEYFRRYYAVDEQSNSELEQAILSLDFVGTAGNYRWIPGNGVNILVPYALQREEYDRLANQARAGKIDAAWLRAARPLAVSLRDDHRQPILDQCEEVRHKGEATGWYILLDEQAYDAALGLVPTGDPDRRYLV